MPAAADKKINVAVIGHAYNLYDTRVSMDIFNKLESYGVGHYSAYNLTDVQLKDGMIKLCLIVKSILIYIFANICTHFSWVGLLGHKVITYVVVVDSAELL